MEFKKLLAHYRERSGLTKTGLAERLNISPTYAMEIESRRKPPPALSRCVEISKILNLSGHERDSLIDAAMFERINEETLLWLHEREQKHLRMENIVTAEVLDALKIPMEKKVLLATHRSDEETKKLIYGIILALENVPKENVKPLLKLGRDMINNKRLITGPSDNIKKIEKDKHEGTESSQ